MGFAAGWAALNLEMPERVPRTEYSVTEHWEVLQHVTGLPVAADSPPEVKRDAQRRFLKAWDFSFLWSTYVGGNVIRARGRTTRMGHAVYAAGGVDFNTEIACPFKDAEEALAFDPEAEYGPIDRADMTRQMEEHYQRNCAYYADAVNMSGVYTTVVSGLIEIFGWELLLEAAGTDPRRFGELTRRYEAWIRPCFEAFADSRIPVMMCHDDMVWTSGAIFHPDWYRTYVFPAYKRLWRPVLDAGKRLVFTSDGNYTAFFDDIVDAGAHSLVMEPTCDMAAFAAKYGRTHGFIGNADTRILLSGSREEICAEVQRCMEIGRPSPGFIMAVGNHIPPNTPVESVLYYNEVYEQMARR
jgi:hypothetical protein